MNYRAFIKQYFLVLGVLSIPIFMNIVFVVRAKENASYRSIVAEQQRTGSIYGSAFNAGSAAYRIELARRLDPEIAAVGSSRVMSFRKELFAGPFANLGGVVANLEEGKSFVDQLVRLRAPKVILFGIDYWWMNQMANKISPNLDGDILTFRKLTTPLIWLANGKLEPDLFADILLGRPRGHAMTTLPTLGIYATKTMGGMRPDGSVHYGEQFFETPDRNSEPRDTWNMQQHDLRIRGGRPVDARNVEMLKDIIREMESHGSHVVVFIPPVAPAIREAIAKDSAAARYVESFRATLKSALGPGMFDFHALVPGGDDDCEFIDGYHGGEITYARILKAMAASDPVLGSVVNGPAIDSILAHLKGHALAVLDPDAYRARETDFLALGCRK